MDLVNFEDFKKINIAVGRIIDINDFPEAKKPAFKLRIDFGPLGLKNSSAQITKLYSKSDLLDKLILAVVNFPSKQVGPFVSEVLVLGVSNSNGDIVLVSPESDVPLGVLLH